MYCSFNQYRHLEIVYKFQNVLQLTDLKNSELLYNFLTVEDFSKSVTEIRIGETKIKDGKLCIYVTSIIIF